MAGEISYKSYCWAVGTTSYRTDNFNLNIELQLKLMDEFRSLPENRGVCWKSNNAFQKAYYDFLKARDFVKGDAGRPDKDAREKTSGLVDIGLMDGDRNLTEAGRSLLEIAENGAYRSYDNHLEIANDSYLYLKQMLKTCNDVDGKPVRPFLVFLCLVSRLGYLTYEEFTYLLPLCVDRETTEMIASSIEAGRKGRVDVDEIIFSVIMKKDNYQAALELFKTSEITENLICTIGINRKSKNYDKPYYEIYNRMKAIIFEKDGAAVYPLYLATKKLTNGKVGGAWRKYLFKTSSQAAIKKDRLQALSDEAVFRSETVEEFHDHFFRAMHLFKARATLSDYFDLNRRYFKVTDTVIFEDNKVRLDILPQCYFGAVADQLMEYAFEESGQLEADVPIEAIAPCLKVDLKGLFARLSAVVGRPVSNIAEARGVIRDERYERFDRLVDHHFPIPVLVDLLSRFEKRDDEEIRRLVTDNADIPTIFEYILGVAWYVISGRKGNVLEFMNLSLEADLLPKTHAGGGEADIVWEYEATADYPEHTLLIEATLADRTNQRRMEMEPVSRHLGDYLLSHRDREAYCIFLTTCLYWNVISDFRGRKDMYYYSNDGSQAVCGMKILPAETGVLKHMLLNGIRYEDVYRGMEAAFVDDTPPKEWYTQQIEKRFF